MIEEYFDPARLTLVGLLVGLVVAFIRGWIVPGWAYKERDDEVTHIRGQRDAMIAQFHESVIPAMVRSTDALERATRTLERHVG